jgi:predicted short-subunit dehydrogenase-like oxidoreductase (DUF2520 family)
MGGEPVVIPESARAAYAEAIATATTFSAAIVAQATQALAQSGVENAADVLVPLIRSTVDNALRNSGGLRTADVPPSFGSI